jgi:hypothetical protein
MTGFKSKRQAALDEEGMYLVHHTEPAQKPTLQEKDRKRGSIALARSLCYKINGAADDSDDMDGGGYGSVDIAEILSAEVVRLQAALAQPAQEPVVWMGYDRGLKTFTAQQRIADAYPEIYTVPLYPSLPQRPWLDLTDEEISDIAINNPPMVHEFARAVLAKSKEKNNG